MDQIYSNATIESKELGGLLLEIGTLLLKAGASCNRTKVVITAVANSYHYIPDMTIGPNSISLSINDANGVTLFDGIRGITSSGIDFKLIAGLSRLPSLVKEKKLSVAELKSELNNLRQTQPYSRIVILCFVSLAGAAFCYTFGGSAIEMIIAFAATFCGLFAKQQLTRLKTNPYICTYLAATVASTVTAIVHVTGISVSPLNAFSTCVLFLIPGVLLINCFTDLIDGHILNGIAGGMGALMHSLAIALGLVTTIITFNLT